MELKFRVWDGERMHYDGAYQKESYQDPIRGRIEKQYFFPFDGIESGSMVAGDGITEFETMFATGMKDMRGREIYAGDLVKNQTGRICKVEYRLPYAGFDFTVVANTIGTDNYGFTSYRSHLYLEVIGNIYENEDMYLKKISR